MKSRRNLIAAVVLATIFLTLGASMAFGKTFVLCSSFSGKLVTGNEQPAAGIRIVRSWKWGFNSQSGSDETTTDSEGRFQLPPVTGKSLFAGLAPHEPSIGQEIVAHGPNGPVVIWSADKSNYDMDGELDGRKIDAICSLDKKPSADGLYWGTCVEAR
jgi:hypothetical protein